MHGYDIPLGCEFRPEAALGGTLSLSPELLAREVGNVKFCCGCFSPRFFCNNFAVCSFSAKI